MRSPEETQSAIEGGIVGLLVGDALGLPYENGRPSEIPRASGRKLEMGELAGRVGSHPVPTGTWSDDGAAALCMLRSLTRTGRLDPDNAARGLIEWMTKGAMTVDGHVFDIGIQTTEALYRFQSGTPALESGLAGVRNNGNGSLMRVLPFGLDPRLSDGELVNDAFRQSRITHRHPRSLVCCALYALWVRRQLQAPTGTSSEECWQDATDTLRSILPMGTVERNELEHEIRPDAKAWGTGSGYVVDSLHSARWACLADSYEAVVTRAINLGNDTDTTASLAGGIAGIRFTVAGIPERWTKAIRGLSMAYDLLAEYRAQLQTALAG